MLAIFCLRLACGLIASLAVLMPSQVPPRFFRVQYLTALGLLAVAAFFLRDQADFYLWLALGCGMVCTFIGSIVWHLDNNPGHLLVLILTNLALMAALYLSTFPRSNWIALCDNFASAALLGSATSAMLMGHSYLIAPTMSLSPLYRLIGALGVTLILRVILAALGLYWWTDGQPAGNLETEMLLWLVVRWIVGLVGPLVLGWMAYETARIRSTQSATGILYVVVILGFLGELTSQLLFEKTRLFL